MVLLAAAEPGGGEGLAGEAAREQVDAPVPRAVEVSNISVDGHAGPVPTEDGAAEAVGLDERDGGEARRLRGEVEAADAAEEREVGEDGRLGVNGGSLRDGSVPILHRAPCSRDSQPPAARRARAARNRATSPGLNVRWASGIHLPRENDMTYSEDRIVLFIDARGSSGAYVVAAPGDDATKARLGDDAQDAAAALRETGAGWVANDVALALERKGWAISWAGLVEVAA